MKRSVLALLLALSALAACEDAPPGQLKPIPRPAGYQEPAKAEPPPPAPAPAADPSKVLLRWQLLPGAPLAFRLVGTWAQAPAPPPARPARSAKGARAPPAPPPTPPPARGLQLLYVLERPEGGDAVLRIRPEGAEQAPDQGTFSERGFILDGLGAVDRNTATLVLELPRERVGVGDTWSLGVLLVDTSLLGPDFLQKHSERRNTVKLVALAPEGQEQVATLEYALHERVSGLLPPLRSAPKKHAHAGKHAHGHEHEEEKPAEPRPVSAEVTFTGRAEFLVKAGRWRSWQGTLASKTEGYTPASAQKALAQVPAGTLALRLTPLDSVPAEPPPRASP